MYQFRSDPATLLNASRPTTDQVHGYHNRQGPICSKIRSLLMSLGPLGHDRVAPKIEYWIEYVLREGFITVDELVERVSGVAWEGGNSRSARVGRFLKEFYDAPHRSEKARSFVSLLCLYILRWFAIASSENLHLSSQGLVSIHGAGFVKAASFVGHLIESGLLGHELVQRHLIKPLTNHQDHDKDINAAGAVRARAIYELFLAAGNTLLRGILEPDDVQACFDILDARPHWEMKFDTAKVKEFREIHIEWMRRQEEQKVSKEIKEHESGGGEDMVAAEVSVEAKTPVAFVSQDLPIVTIATEIAPSILQEIESSSVFSDGGSSIESFVDVPSGTASPTSSLSTVSDLTSTEFGEEIEHSEKRTTTRHDTFYFEDGNVEIACGDTIFRVHSSVVSFSSSELREILSQQALINAPTPEGRPRIAVPDSVQDFTVLLKMIYTPGFPASYEVPEFSVFASLLRMTTKYGFSNIRGQLVKELKRAYPTKWEDFRSAKVLGEDVFGSPKPHPNTVLNLFEAQNLKFAIPFAAYRASIGGFQTLMSDKPGTVLSRRTLVSTSQGFHNLSAAASHLAHIVVYDGPLSECPEKTCILKTIMNSGGKRTEALERACLAMVDEREGGLLSPPSVKHLLCKRCAVYAEASHTEWGSLSWEGLPQTFNLSRSWDDL